MKTKENHYDVLGIHKEADVKEVKAAYRRLSKLLHPDVCTLPDADERFQLAKQAYETLMDDTKRKKYDQALARGEKPWEDDAFGHFDQSFGGFYKRPATGRPPIDGIPFRHTMTYSVSDVLNQDDVTIHVTARDRCTTCAATGKVPKKGKSECAACRGKGFTMETKRDPISGSYTTTRRCEPCEGTGDVLEEVCPDCHGERTVEVVREVTFSIPETIQDGKVIRITGRGGVGLFGGSDGDLLVTLRRDREDPALVTDTGDVIYHIVLPPELFFQGKVTIERFDGKNETCKLDPHPGARHIIPKAGLGDATGKRGDVIYLFYPDLPKRGS